MKFLLHVTLLALILTTFCFGQWMEQPFSASESLFKVRFADSTNGWILGENHIFKTTDAGNSWFPQDSSVGDFGTALTVLNTETAFYSCYTNSAPYFGLIRKTTDSGLTWQTVDSLSFACFDIQFLNDQVGYAGGGTLPDYNPMLRKTTDGGSTWSTVWSGTGNYEIEGLHFLDSDNAWAVLYNAVIMKTTDGGVSWAVSDSIHPPNLSLPLKDITFTTPDSGWAVGGIAGNSIVVRTTDAGSQWSYQVFTGSSLREVRFFNSNVGWICGANDFEPFIAKTTDGGENWTTQHEIPYTGAGAESFSMVNTSLGWAVNYDGEVYKTTNGGVTFIEGGGVPSQPVSMHLFQNYPNPFNPVTSIQYAINSKQYVTLKVYDLLGNEIASLVNEEKPAGTYEVTWDGANMPSGVYFYKIKAGKFIQTKKMILLK